MQGSKGIVIGFVAGLAAMGCGVLLLRDAAVDAGIHGGARVDQLDAQIQRLEATVNRLSALAGPVAPVASTAAGEAGGAAPLSPAEQAAEAERRKVEARASVAAHAIVEQALQTGQWTRAQRHEFNLVASELDGDEYASLMARIAAAINNDQIRPELP